MVNQSNNGTGPRDYRDAAREAGAEAKHAAEDVGRDFKSSARGFADEARRRAQGAVDKQRAAAAEEIHGVADAVRRSASDLESQGHDHMAGYINRAAGSIDEMSERLRDQDLGALVSGVEDFARRQPLLFFGAAAAAGFVLTRFLKSSADSRYEDDDIYGDVYYDDLDDPYGDPDLTDDYTGSSRYATEEVAPGTPGPNSTTSVGQPTITPVSSSNPGTVSPPKSSTADSSDTPLTTPPGGEASGFTTAGSIRPGDNTGRS